MNIFLLRMSFVSFCSTNNVIHFNTDINADALIDILQF